MTRKENVGKAEEREREVVEARGRGRAGKWTGEGVEDGGRTGGGRRSGGAPPRCSFVHGSAKQKRAMEKKINGGSLILLVPRCLPGTMLERVCGLTTGNWPFYFT